MNTLIFDIVYDARNITAPLYLGIKDVMERYCSNKNELPANVMEVLVYTQVKSTLADICSVYDNNRANFITMVSRMVTYPDVVDVYDLTNSYPQLPDFSTMQGKRMVAELIFLYTVAAELLWSMMSIELSQLRIQTIEPALVDATTLVLKVYHNV